MKKYQHVLTVAAIVFASATSLAGYDEFECVTNPNLESANLQCISCGISKYYADKGMEVTPSHKWLALLALKAREQGLGVSNGVVRSDLAKERLQKSIIAEIQAYGFCTEYLGKNTLKNGRSKNYHDVSAEEWRVFFEFINRDKIPPEKGYAKIAEQLGFKNPGFFGKGTAKDNMDYLFQGAFENLSLDEKRALFKEKLNEGLAPDYNVSGDPVEKAKEFIAAGDKDQGLRNCLSDIKKRFFEQQMSDKDTFQLCETVATSCDLSRTPMDSKNDFCIHKGMGLRPVQPPPTQIPPPPRPAKSRPGKGIK